jgi:RimJ/RimL family protein N-acetyltransferase
MNRPGGVVTRRLELRPLADGDAAFIVELLNDADFLRFIGDRGVRSVEDARRYIETGPQASYAKHGHGLDLVTERGTGRRAGICGILRRETLDEPDLGFAFLPAFRGRGFALEAAEAALEDARDRLRLPRVLAIASPDNHRSIALLTKLGFIERGLERVGDSDARVFARDLGRATSADRLGSRTS